MKETRTIMAMPVVIDIVDSNANKDVFEMNKVSNLIHR